MSPRDQTRCPQCNVLNEPGALFCSRCGASLNRPGYQGTRRRMSAAGVTMAFAMLLALGLAVLTLALIVYRVMRPEPEVDVYSGLTGTTATIVQTVAGGSGQETPITVGGAIQLRPRAVSSSSTLQASKTQDYRPTNLVDGDLSTAWCEGVSGPGPGEWVRFEFSRPLTVTRIEIANGYQQDTERFYANGRAKTIELEYSDGATQLVDLLDTLGFQAIEPAVSETEWIKLTIISVYPKRAWDDTALSEVRVYETADRL